MADESGLSHLQLLLIVFGTILVVVVMTVIGYWACYRQKTTHDSHRGRDGGEAGDGNEGDPLLRGEGGGGRRSAHHQDSPGRRGSSPVPSASKSWIQSYGELGRSQVASINRWVDDVVKSNREEDGGYLPIEDQDLNMHWEASGMGSPFSSSGMLSPTSGKTDPLSASNTLRGDIGLGESSGRISQGGSPRVSMSGGSLFSASDNGSSGGGGAPLKKDETMPGPKDPLEF